MLSIDRSVCLFRSVFTRVKQLFAKRWNLMVESCLSVRILEALEFQRVVLSFSVRSRWEDTYQDNDAPSKMLNFIRRRLVAHETLTVVTQRPRRAIYFANNITALRERHKIRTHILTYSHAHIHTLIYSHINIFTYFQCEGAIKSRHKYVSSSKCTIGGSEPQKPFAKFLHHGKNSYVFQFI